MLRLLLFAAATALPLFCQETYRADFKIKDDVSKPRRYLMLIEAGASNNFRTGAKVPIVTTMGPNGTASQFSYVDTGLMLDVKLRKTESGKLSMSMTLELSGIQGGEKPQGATPLVTTVRASITAIVTPGKPVVLTSIEDPATSRRMDVEVTLTPVAD